MNPYNIKILFLKKKIKPFYYINPFKEKKKEWAENFLKSYYKLQELKKKRKEKEKERSKLESILTTDDMKPFINMKRPDDEVDMLKIEKKEINDDDYHHQHFVKLGSTDDFFKTGPKHREMETKLAEFQTHKGLR